MTRNGLRYSAEVSVHSEVQGRENSKEFKTERNGIPRKKLVLQNSKKVIYRCLKSTLFWQYFINLRLPRFVVGGGAILIYIKKTQHN
jgi:hypothetical protein